jgi:hypothetical protein
VRIKVYLRHREQPVVILAPSLNGQEIYKDIARLMGSKNPPFSAVIEDTLLVRDEVQAITVEKDN